VAAGLIGNRAWPIMPDLDQLTPTEPGGVCETLLVRFVVRPMVESDAAAVASWHYDGEYTFYDFDQDAGDLAELLDPAGWGNSYYAVDDEDSVLVGFFQFVRCGDIVDIGLGLRPGLVGRGLGAGFLDSGLRFAIERFGVERFTLDVAAFNRRHHRLSACGLPGGRPVHARHQRFASSLRANGSMITIHAGSVGCDRECVARSCGQN
jgi:ribosomal-protein-alanine N-acetyltransferase